MLLVSATAQADGSSGVVLAYQKVAEGTPATTSIRPETFEAHLDHLAAQGVEVWSLARLVAAVRGGATLPDRVVAITFDGAHASLYHEAWPRLRVRDWPFTVFVSPDRIDAEDEGRASWQQLRAMAADGAVIANHSWSGRSLAQPAEEETEAGWLNRLRADIESAQQRLAEEIGEAPALFSWPHGEHSPAAREVLVELDLVGFGRQPGAIGPLSDLTALPRFPLTVGFDDVESFAIKVRSRPLPVVATEPASGVMDPEQREPVLEIELAAEAVAEENFASGALACYSRGQDLAIEWLDDEHRRFRIRGEEIVGSGRTRFDCTAPITDENRWYWYSFEWMMPPREGGWYRD